MKQPMDPRNFAVAAGLALACALLMGFVLGSLAKPERFHGRMQIVDRQVKEAGRLRPARNAKAYRSDAVCSRSATEQALMLRSAIAAQAAQLKLELAVADIAPVGDGGSDSGLETVRVRFEVRGGYEAGLTLLDTLDRGAPQVFADTLDITAEGPLSRFSFSGRAFCSAGT